MTEDQVERADRLLEEALASSGARDPRVFYRDRLRDLKQANPTGYDEAVAYYRDTLIPAVAEGTHHPLEAWTSYGKKLAEMLAPGRTIAVDSTGLAAPYEAPAGDRLVLHLPDEKKGKAILVGLPPELSPAQRATFDVLVAGKRERGDG